MKHMDIKIKTVKHSNYQEIYVDGELVGEVIKVNSGSRSGGVWKATSLDKSIVRTDGGTRKDCVLEFVKIVKGL